MDFYTHLINTKFTLDQLKTSKTPVALNKRDAVYFVEIFDALDNARMEITGKSEACPIIEKFIADAYAASGTKEFGFRTTAGALRKMYEITYDLYFWLLDHPCTFKGQSLIHKNDCIICRTKTIINELDEEYQGLQNDA